MSAKDPVKETANDPVERQVRLRLNPLASLIVRTRWFRRLSGLAVRPAGSVWSNVSNSQRSGPAGGDDVSQEPLGPEELRIIRRNALASALMRSACRWGR